jgi:hypothetical protein
MFMNYKLLRYSLLSMLFMLCGGWMQADEVETIASATFDGKNKTYTEGWSTTGTGLGRTDCVVIGFEENITSPEFDLSGYSEVTISIKSRRYGTLSGSKATIDASIDGVSVGTTEATGTNASTALADITFEPTPSMTSAVFVFTCTNATSPGESHGAGINSITIKGTKTGSTDPVTTVDYYLTGSFNNWATNDANYKFTENASSEGEYMLQNVVFEDDDFEAGAVEFKVVSSAGNWYPSSNLQINEAGTYNFYFRPDGQGGTDWSEGFIYVQKVESTDPEPVATLEDGFYLVGSFNNWTASADYKFVENASNAGEYVLSSISLTAGTEIKAVKVENNAISTWYPSGANYVVKKTGSHDIYFRPDGQGNADWHEGTLYVTNEETTPATEGAFQLTSVSENGTIHFYLGDNEVTEANAGDQIVAVVTPNDGYAIDWSSVQVKACASFTDAQTPLTNAPGVLQDVDWVKDEQARTIRFTMPEANVRITVAYTVDKSVLEELITNAEELADNIEDADIKGALQTAIGNAKAVDQNADATVEEVAAATDALNDAMIAALRALDALKVEVTVPAGSYATMFLDKKRALETAVEGVKLYTITAVDVANKQVVLSDELTVIDSQTPFIIANEGNADADIVLAVAAGTPTEVTVAPEFKGTLDAKTFTADDMAAADYYTLHGSNFVWTPDAGTIGANKCWIELPKSGDAPAPSLAIVGGEGTTGINSLTPALSEGEGVYYDLSGRRVAQPTKGLYIINGKKVVLK